MVVHYRDFFHWLGFGYNINKAYRFLQHFLQLHFFKKQFEAVEIATDNGVDVLGKETDEEEGSVFDEAVALLQRLEKELVGEITNTVVLDVKAKSRAYRTDKWFAMQSEKEVASLSVTPSGCPIFQELAMRLNDLQEALALPLFNQAWRNLASQLDQVSTSRFCYLSTVLSGLILIFSKF